MPQKKLFLLDAMALIYRAYYALNKNPRINSKGMNTSAVLGFANTLFDLIKKEKPTHIGVAFDTMAPSVRVDDFIEYKANRESTPEDIISSIPYIKRIIEGFNIPILFVDGYEADDVIGTLAKRAEKAGFTTYMMTPDKDFGQLVSENIFIYKPAKFGNAAEIMGVAEVCAKFSIQRPDQVKDLLGLWGDASDNIPGIPGVGEVTAKKLLADFDNVENLIEKASEIKNEKIKLKVIEHARQALLSKQLATIILDVPIDFNEQALLLTEPDEAKLKAVFEDLEFRTFAKRVFPESSQIKTVEPVKTIQGGQVSLFDTDDSYTEVTPASTPKKTINNAKYQLIDTLDGVKELVKKLFPQTSFCFDTETTGLDVKNAELVGISFSYEPGNASFILIPEDRTSAESFVSLLKPLLENPKTIKIGQNLKFDIAMLKNYGITVQGPLFDTMLAHYLLEPDMRHNMDSLAANCLNYSTVSIETLIGKKGKNQRSMRQVDVETLKDYACEDADITLQLKNHFEPLLEKANLRTLLDTIEVPLIPVLVSMESEGVKIDIPALKTYSSQLLTEIKEIESQIFQMAGFEFNIASPRQLGEVLFDRLKIVENSKLTKTKQYQTGEEILIKLVAKHPIVQLILDFRSLTKLKSTYVDTLPGMVNSITGRIHTSYNQAVAATGRLSSNNPNLQNIPIRTERGREIRKAFIPRNDEYILLSADYSQIELRIIAEISKDEGMAEAFKNNLDIHTATAAKIYNVDLESVTKDMRRNAKTVNFGIIYGISAFGLSERLNIPRKEAGEIISQYFAKYPSIKDYMENTILFARKNGYVETICNRKRYIRDINSGNGIVRGFAERNTINAPIQGSAADMIKIAMIRIHKEFEEKNLKSRMTMQVHDELVFDVHHEEVNLVKPIIEQCMKTAIPMTIPVEIEMNTGKNWLEAH